LRYGGKNIIFDNSGGDVEAIIKYEQVTPEIKAELQEQSDDTYKKLTVNEKSGVDGYTLSDYIDINTGLREKHGISDELEPEIQAKIEYIDAAMDKFELARNIVVFRGDEAEHYRDWKVGKIEYLHGYTSTSVSESVVRENYTEYLGDRIKADRVIIEINVPKGTPSMYIGENTQAATNEEELLLKRGLKYKIIDRKDKFLKLEVVP
jgi:hypothetical protein